MSQEPIFQGVGVALLTCFDDRGGLDTVATADHAARLVDHGVRAVVVAGTTGEAAALDRRERAALLDAVRRAVPDVPVIAGTGAPASRDAAVLTADAAEHGADAALVLSPPRVEDPRRYYRDVADAAPGLPLLAYHFPGVSPPGIPVEMLAALPVRGVKDSAGSAERLLSEASEYDGEVYVGAAPLLTLAGPIGLTGAILALANAEPSDCIAAFAGDPDAQLRLLPHHRAAQRAFPHGLKEITAARFGIPAGARLG